MLCRMRYIDEKLQAADSRIDAAVILGAGFDTRAYRLPVLAATLVYEIDLSPRQHRPQADETDQALRRDTRQCHLGVHRCRDPGPHRCLGQPRLPARATDVLRLGGGHPVSEEAGVRKTFDFLATAAPGSHLVFTYVAQWPRVASVGDRTFSLRQKDLSANSPSPAVRGRTDCRIDADGRSGRRDRIAAKTLSFGEIWIAQPSLPCPGGWS